METKKPQLNSLSKQDNSFFEFLLNKTTKLGKKLLPVLCFVILAQILFAAGNQANIHQLQKQIINNPKDVDAHLKLAIEYSMANDL